MSAKDNLAETISGPGHNDAQQLIDNRSPEPLVDRAEALRQLDWTYITLYRRTKRGMWGVYGKHRNARYRVSEMLEWLRIHENGATSGKKAQR